MLMKKDLYKYMNLFNLILFNVFNKVNPDNNPDAFGGAPEIEIEPFDRGVITGVFWTTCVFVVFLFIIWFIKELKENKNKNSLENSLIDVIIEELEKYNELKGKGIITQEEFDKKKKELLNLNET